MLHGIFGPYSYRESVCLFIRLSNVTRNPVLLFAKYPSPTQGILHLNAVLRGSGSFMFLFHLSPHSALLPMLQAHWHSGSMRTCLAPTPLSPLLLSLLSAWNALLLCSCAAGPFSPFSYQCRWHLLERSFLVITSQIDHPSWSLEEKLWLT